MHIHSHSHSHSQSHIHGHVNRVDCGDYTIAVIEDIEDEEEEELYVRRNE